MGKSQVRLTRGNHPGAIRRSLPVGEFRSSLLAWYDANARDLPWRRTSDPYAIWVSEIMLQQTRVAAVIERYSEFLQAFPTVAALAAASEGEVLARWSGLGYYRRARMLHHAAQAVVAQYGSQLPATAAALRTLPGIGAYTSAAIASIAFGEAAAVVDGNVERVLLRVFGETDMAGVSSTRVSSATLIQQQADRLLDPRRPGDFNQAMMELGATLCLPRNPLCLQCPVLALCRTRGEHLATPRKKMSSQRVAYGLTLGAAGSGRLRVLLQQRSAEATVMTGMWELPSIDNGAAQPDRVLLTVRHAIMATNYFVRIVEVLPSAAGTDPEDNRGSENSGRRWFFTEELHALPLTGLARKVLLKMKLMPLKASAPVLR